MNRRVHSVGHVATAFTQSERRLSPAGFDDAPVAVGGWPIVRLVRRVYGVRRIAGGGEYIEFRAPSGCASSAATTAEATCRANEIHRDPGFRSLRYVRYADLCRARHKSAYAEARVMPTWLLDALVRAVSRLSGVGIILRGRPVVCLSGVVSVPPDGEMIMETDDGSGLRAAGRGPRCWRSSAAGWTGSGACRRCRCGAIPSSRRRSWPGSAGRARSASWTRAR